MSEAAKALLRAALPAYEIADELGRGAFGVVYEARHTQLGRHVAIKQLPQSFAENDDVRERFLAEAQMVASLDHPHVVPVYDFVEHEGSRFLIMERCAGSVGDRFKSDGIVTDEACAAVLACLSALDVAHQKGLLHRDVKPENLMYDTKGVVKLGDFGIARDLGLDTRRTATGVIIGTPAYMSPEQCRGDDLTPASDVYSVAMMGYELLTGALPFPNTDSVNGMLAHHLVTEPTPLLQTRPELPGAVGEVIDRALAKDLNVRYSSAAEFATMLARACVKAFGSGWLRRRRFVLHWPTIIAETERPDENSPRTGTILVRAGELRAGLPEVKNPAADPAGEPTPPEGPNPAESPAEPVAFVADVAAPQVVGSNADAPTLPEPAPAPVVTTPLAVASSIDAAVPATRGSGAKWPLIGGLAAAIAAVVIGVIVFAGGGADAPDVTVSADVSRAEATVAPEQTGAAEPTLVPTQEPVAPTAVPAEVIAPTPPPPPPTIEQVPTTVPTAGPADLVTAEEQPLVLGSNGNPILNRLPLDFDPSIVDSPWTATPCPIEQEIVACIFAAVVPDEETGAIEVAWLTLGFTPRLDPAEQHLHFYIPELVDGDEAKAGNAVPGGSWRIWDGPWPATSFGGDGGRSLYTLADFEQAGSTTLCVVAATADHQAIPGTGNCAPVAAVGNQEVLATMVNRIEGQWVGRCSDQAMAIAPDDWRWYSFNDYTASELAAEIRPTDIAQTTELLETFVAQGGVVWAEGPVVDGKIISFSLSVVPGSFGMNDSPQAVADTLAQLGVNTDAFSARDVDGRALLVGPGPGQNSMTYFIPDFDYTVALTFRAPSGAGLAELADQIAYTATGC